MHWLYDIWQTNKNIFIKTNKLMGEHPLLMYIGLVYIPILAAAVYAASAIRFFGGMILAFAIAAVLSNYFHLIDLAIKGYRTAWQDVREGFFVYSRKLFNILFILYVANFGVNLLIMPLLPGLLKVLVGLILWNGLLLVLNALPEVIYQKPYGEVDSLKYALSFERKNLLAWYVPNLALYGLVIGTQMLVLKYLMPWAGQLPGPVALGVVIVSLLLISQFVLAYWMLYRGQLFHLLDTTSRQRRIMKITH